MSRVLVTGGNGYLGWHVVNELLSRGFQVRVLDTNLYDFPTRNDVEFIFGDIRDKEVVKKALEDVDSVIHLAALSNDPSCEVFADLAIEVNYNGTKNVGTLAKESGVRRLIFMSSCSIYGGLDKGDLDEEAKIAPLTLYAYTKVASEEFLKKITDDSFDTCIFRAATLYGYSKHMRFDLVANIIPVEAVIDGEIKLFGGGKQLRPLLHVKDTAKILVMAIESSDNFKGDPLNLGFNEDNYSILDLTNKIKENIFPDKPIKEFPSNVDARSYAVNFNKFKKKFNFNNKSDLIESVKEIKRSIESKEFENPRDEQYVRVKYLLKKKFV